MKASTRKLSDAMHPAQIAYVNARAVFEVLNAEDNATDEACELWADAMDAMVLARAAVMTWGRTMVETCPRTAAKFAANKTELDALFDYCERNTTMRDRVLDLVMRLRTEAR